MNGLEFISKRNFRKSWFNQTPENSNEKSPILSQPTESSLIQKRRGFSVRNFNSVLIDAPEKNQELDSPFGNVLTNKMKDSKEGSKWIKKNKNPSMMEVSAEDSFSQTSLSINSNSPAYFHSPLPRPEKDSKLELVEEM